MPVKSLNPLKPLRSRRMFVSVAGVATAGIVAILVTMAAGVFMAVEPESGTLANGATQITDAAASGGKAVQFGSASPSPSPTPTGNACIQPGFGTCGPYSDPAITPSNGYNTYVVNQDGACGGDQTGKYCGPQTLTSYGPGNWSLVSTMPANYTGVRSYPDIGQLTNNWGTKGFNGGSDMPISGVSAISSTYTETMNENSGTFAEAAYDIWTSSGEVMVWVDTTDNRGSGGAVQKGSGTLSGYPFTYYVYDNSLPIIKLNTNQRSATIDLLAALQYFESQGVVASNATIGQLNFGWELCSTGGVPETFQVSNYSLTITPK